MKRKVNVVRTYSQNISNFAALKRAFVSDILLLYFEKKKLITRRVTLNKYRLLEK